MSPQQAHCLPAQRLLLLTLLFEVYPGEAHPCDSSEVAGKRRTHMKKLLHPDLAGDADVQHVLVVDMKDLSVFCEGLAAGYAPGGGKTVFVWQFAQTAAHGVTQNISHALHTEPRSGLENRRWRP
jgi:hypothetical protein